MQCVKSYYAAKAVIRYYGPGFEREWPDAPHVAFANLRLDLAALKMFTRRYGPLYIAEWSLIDRLQIALAEKRGLNPLWDVAIPRIASFVPDLQRASEMQTTLVKAWRKDSYALGEIEHGINLFPWFGISDKALRPIVPDLEGVTLFADDMWNFIRAAFLLDYKAGRARICKNPDCPAPYFLQSRKGQEFCTHKCAVLINVRRFRELQRKAAGSKTQKQSQSRKRGRRKKR